MTYCSFTIDRYNHWRDIDEDLLAWAKRDPRFEELLRYIDYYEVSNTVHQAYRDGTLMLHMLANMCRLFQTDVTNIEMEKKYWDWCKLDKYMEKQQRPKSWFSSLPEYNSYIFKSIEVNRRHFRQTLTLEMVCDIMMDTRRLLAIDHVGTCPLRPIYTKDRSHEVEDKKRWEEGRWFIYKVDLTGRQQENDL